MLIRRLPYLSLLCIALVALPLAAQETGSISGTLLDPDGAPLPGVTVTVDGSLIPATTKHSQINGVYRFPTIPPASDYTLTFRLDGFQEIVHEGLIVALGGNIQINVSMVPAGVTEAVIVRGESPLVDVKKTGTGNNVTEQYMQSIPSARDPWVMLEHTSGVQVASQNVGGSGSGDQDIFSANGSDVNDTVWTYDGAEITGQAGQSSLYYDFDALEEIAITTGGNDPSIATGGIRVNFVTKRGGSNWRGSARLYVTDGDLQGHTVADPETGELAGEYTEDELVPGYVGNSIDNIKDWGAELGGPLVRDRVFGWGAYGRQDIRTLVNATPDNTRLTNWHGKANAHFGDDTVANFTFISSRKTKQGVGASAFRPLETTQDQDGLTSIYTAKVQHSFNDNNYLEATFNHMGDGFSQEPRGGRDVQSRRDYATGVYGRTYRFFGTDGASTNARLDGNSYLAGAEVDHELKYGYSFRDRDRSVRSGWPQGARAWFDGGVPVEAWLTRDALDNYGQRRHSLYLGDTISSGRTTINLGLRYDRQTSVSLPSSLPASPYEPDLFPGNSFPGYDPGYGWNSLSPRLGLTYDLSGDARTILRLNAARYYAQMTENEFHRTNTTGFREMDFAWGDLNGNESVDQGETGDLLWISGGWDPSDPSAPSSNVVAETSPPWTNEIIVGIERQLTRSLTVGGNFTYRQHGNHTWNIRAGEDDPDFWREVTQNVSGYGELTVYEPVGPRSTFNVYQQRDGFSSRASGVELFLAKRFADRWMANASFNYSQTTDHFGPGSYTDPTNIEQLNGQPQRSAYSRRDATWATARWYLRSSGMYQLPAGFAVAGYFQVREGYVNPQTVLSNPRRFGAGRIDVYAEDFGTTRLPTYWNLDLRAEKTFDLADRGRVHLIVDAFNVTNNGAILGKEGRLNSPFHGRITNVLQGRTIRFGLRMVLR